LRDLLGARLGGELGAPAIERLAGALVHYVREEQAVLASTSALQGVINALLARPAPTRPLRVLDFRMLFTMHSGPLSVFPYVFETLGDELGVGVECTADTLEVTET
jgi:hypothetical protein